MKRYDPNTFDPPCRHCGGVRAIGCITSGSGIAGYRWNCRDCGTENEGEIRPPAIHPAAERRPDHAMLNIGELYDFVIAIASDGYRIALESPEGFAADRRGRGLFDFYGIPEEPGIYTVIARSGKAGFRVVQHERMRLVPSGCVESVPEEAESTNREDSP